LIPLNLIPTPINKPIQSSAPAPTREESGEEIPEEVQESYKKSLDTDQKRLRWEAYAKKTERQEEMFKRVSDDVFKHQSSLVIAEFARTGNLPPLDDETTAKRFEAAIQLVYEDAFESAV
jgi:hypothetical protein